MRKQLRDYVNQGGEGLDEIAQRAALLTR